MRKNVALALAGLVIIAFSCGTAWAAPPIFAPIGEERALNSNLYVVEGNLMEFTVSASDPDGDNLTYSAEDLPSWADFSPATGTFRGIAPLWSENYTVRKDQQGIFDVIFKVTDGTYTVSKTVTINVLDSNWTSQTMAQLMANRPIIEGTVGSPVTLENVVDETIWTDFGGGKNIRKITFEFTSQVPDVSGWEQYWMPKCVVYLPVDDPAVYNVGGVLSADEFMEQQYGERACAELDIPILTFRGWTVTPAGSWQSVVNEHFDKAIETRDPRYMWFVFSSAHYLRGVDALVTVMKERTSWSDYYSYSGFKVAVTGVSKFGYTSWTTGAADPQRVAGLMPAGFEPYDHDSYRLLAGEQGAESTMPGAWPTYLGLLMKYYTEPLNNLSEMNSDTRAMLSGATNDMRGTAGAYQSKYMITVGEKEITLPHRVGYVPNAGHTGSTDRHSTYWRMWLAHTFLGRPLSNIDTVRHYPESGQITVEATVSGTPTVNEVKIWATDRNDTDTSAWDGFTSYPMTLSGGVYKGQIPSDRTAYYVEVLDTANGVDGIISSTPRPVVDYLPIRIPPGNISNFQATPDELNNEINLTWTNPPDTNFAGLTLCYKTTGYPTSPTDGIQIYDGTDTACTHTGVGAVTYYYAAFSYDGAGDYSDGVTTNAVGLGVNLPPTADAGPDQSVLVNEAVSFDGSGSNDPDGTIISYLWNFGDGETGTGLSPTHLYSGVGTYTVSLTVTDNNGAIDVDSVTVTVSLASPTNLAVAGGDNQISLSWTASTSPGVAGYRIYRSKTSGGLYTKIAELGLTTSYLDQAGVVGDMLPDDGDGWTESTSGWSSKGGNLILDSADKAVGSTSLRYTGTSPSSQQGMYRRFNVSTIDNSYKLIFWHKGSNVPWRLGCEDKGYDFYDNSTVVKSGSTGANDEWTRIEVDLSDLPITDPDGDSENDADDFYDIGGVVFGSWTSAGFDFRIDGLHFEKLTEDPVNGTTYFYVVTAIDEVPNESGYSNEASATAGGGGNIPPTATANANPISGEAPLTVNFTGSGSDSDGTIVGYSWGFGDGGTSTAQNPTYTYNTAGTYTATLTVTDNEGATGQDTVTITVIGNQPPTATANANPTSGEAPLTVDFFGSGNDPDGTIVSYDWDFGDGVGTSTYQDSIYTYNDPGTYTVTLTVTDDDGAIGQDTVVITVSDAGSSLVGYWKFDEGEGTIAGDSSGNGNDGTLSGGPTWAAGQINGALSFDGNDDYVDCGNGASLDITGEITVTAWIKVGASGGPRALLSKKSPYDAETGYAFFYNYDANGITFWGGGSDRIAAVGSFAWDTNWHHLAAVVNGTTGAIYFDGTDVTTDSTIGAIASNALNVYIGKSAGVGDHNGLLDDVRIYDRALSPEEIAQLAGN